MGKCYEPMKLSALTDRLKISYRSGRDDLIKDFYVPCLESTVLYRRAVGYFTSAGLACAAQGVASLVRRGGSMRLVASPVLNDEDLEAFRVGSEKPDEILWRVASRQLKDIEGLLLHDRLNALAWLIANGSLEVKLAVRLSEDQRPSAGLYHEKIGVFTDADGGHVAFSGSCNETAGGLVNNFESIDVYWSWQDPQNRVREKINDFDALWTNKTPGVRIYEFTEISRELLRDYKQSYSPQVHDSSSSEHLTPSISAEPGTIPAWLEIRDYQRIGLEKWKAAGGKGILAMATGSGKTITALYLACRMHEKIKPLVVIVVCPYVNLALQWVDEIRKFGMDPVCCFRNRQQWEQPLDGALDALLAGVTSILPIVVVNQTFLTDAFQCRLRPTKVQHLLIADEVHNLGASKLQHTLNPLIKYRLGLSATPERYGDEEGTQAILDYFGDVVYEFTLKEAIARNVLCRYFYFPVLVALTENEKERYWELTMQISRAMARGKDGEVNERLRMLLIQRSRLLSAAAEKLPALGQVIASMDEPVRKALVYCGDGRFENSNEEESIRQVSAACRLLGQELGLRVRKFTYEEPEQERVSILAGLRGGTLDAVVAIRCLDEGIDVPDARLGFILASSANPRQFVQRRGRLLRRADGKDFAHIWDFVIDPPDFSGCDDDHAFNVERRLFERELRRILEFCGTAENGAAALHKLQPLRQRYNLLSGG